MKYMREYYLNSPRTKLSSCSNVKGQPFGLSSDNLPINDWRRRSQNASKSPIQSSKKFHHLHQLSSVKALIQESTCQIYHSNPQSTLCDPMGFSIISI